MYFVGINIGIDKTTVSRSPGYNGEQVSQIILNPHSPESLGSKSIDTAICKNNGEWSLVYGHQDYRKPNVIYNFFSCPWEMTVKESEPMREFANLIFDTILENDSDIEDVETAIAEGYFDDDKTIVYDNRQKGFYVTHRKYDASDIRLISECIYSSKYISQTEAERLVNIMKEFVSDDQASEIRTEALVTNRMRTLNKSALRNVSLIYDAMSKMIDGDKHVPEKISFQYLKYDLNNMDKLTERRKGATYKVSPYKLLINEGNYYLLAFDDKSKEMRTYRVDRMTGADVFYMPQSKNTFSVTVDVDISNQFFGWICGFGTQAKVKAPDDVVEMMKEHISKIQSVY